MSYNRNKVLDVARAELGYIEKASNAQLDDKTANSGGGNFTKYARDLDALGFFYNGPKQGQPYCDMGVDWSFVKAYGVEAALKLLCQPLRSAGAGCYYSAMYYKQRGQFHGPNTVPQPGDQIFFTYSPGDVSHTGLVEIVTGRTITVIEFNSSDRVERRRYTVGEGCIYGYGRPDWGMGGNDQDDGAGETDGEAAQQMTPQEIVFAFCRQVLKLCPAAACGVMANIDEESKFDPRAIGDAGTSYGICQWRGERLRGLVSWCENNGKDGRAIIPQLFYMQYELDTTHKATLEALRTVSDTAEGAYEAAKSWCLLFEIPANKEAKAEGRGVLAMNTYWPKYGAGEASEKPAAAKTYTITLTELAEGDEGPAVERVQTLLISRGYTCGGNISKETGVEVPDGEYGPGTTEAVLQFQAASALTVRDGRIGQETMAALLK